MPTAIEIEEDSRVLLVSTGHPVTMMVACHVCGVLLWDIDKHYTDTHATDTSVPVSCSNKECSMNKAHSGPCANYEVNEKNSPTLAVAEAAERFGIQMTMLTAAVIADAAITASGLRKER
jgi:hypothetical protein